MSRQMKLIRFIAPSILGYLSMFLFDIIDGIFVGSGVGTDALGAINLIYPYIMIFFAVCTLFTMGGTTITAIRIGRGDIKGANQVFMHSISLIFLFSLVITVVTIIFNRQICAAMGADETFMSMSSEYLFWFSLFFVPSALMMNLSGFCRNDNDPILVSAASIISTVINITLDWIFIFPLGMGLKGAAIASGISLTIHFLILLLHFAARKGILRFSRFELSFPLTGLMLLRGLPECVSQFSVPISTIITNLMLVQYIGDTGVNTYSVICYIASFSVAVFAGTAEGSQPLFGFSYGARNIKDLRYYFSRALIISVAGAFIILIILSFLDESICRLYALNDPTMAMTLKSLFKYSWGFIVQSATVVISAYLYSTTRTKPALMINILRTFVLNIPVIIIIPMIFGPEAVWYTFGIYESIALVIAVILLIRSERSGNVYSARE